MAVKPPASSSLKHRGALDDLRLWRVKLDVDAKAEAAFRAILSADELARVERLTGPQARRRFVVARGTLRKLLGSLLGERPAAIPIEDGLSGKPRLAGARQGLHFNVSHSGELALICVTAGEPVGVDLEAVRPVPSAAEIARRRFAPAEASFVNEGQPADLDRRFLLCWTRKEAVLKALGMGLDLDLRSFSVPLAPTGGVALIGESDGRSLSERWLLVDVPLDTEHVAAVALPVSVLEGAGAAPGPASAQPPVKLDHCEEIDVLPLIARAGRTS